MSQAPFLASNIYSLTQRVQQPLALSHHSGLWPFLTERLKHFLKRIFWGNKIIPSFLPGVSAGMCQPRVAGTVGAEPFSAKLRYTGGEDSDHPNLIKLTVTMPHIDGETSRQCLYLGKHPVDRGCFLEPSLHYFVFLVTIS